jgi:Tol biopolymer transport system component
VFASAHDELFPDLVRGTRDRIAYTAEDGSRWNIWTMMVTGTSRTPLTTQTPSNQIQPSWSHDATTLAYASNAAQPLLTTAWEIYTVTAAGTTAMKLTSQTPSWAIAPSCSPVSDDILFVSGSKDAAGLAADGGSAIWRWHNGAATMLKDGLGRDGDASPALTGLLTVLGLPAGAGISRPVWSPDGTKIAYAAEDSGQIDIFVMHSDGTDAKTLEAYVTEVGVSNPSITTTADEFCPYWLEDGSGIVYAKEGSPGNFQLHKVTFATGVITDLTGTGSNVSPASKR